MILVKKLMIKILNLKLVIMEKYQNTKIFLLKDILQIDLKKFLLLMLLMILMVKKLFEHSMKKNCKGQINKNLE